MRRIVGVRKVLHSAWEHSHAHTHSHSHTITHTHHGVEHGWSLWEKALSKAASAYFFLLLRLFVTNDVISYVIDIELLLRWLHWLDGAHYLLGGRQVRSLVLLV